MHGTYTAAVAAGAHPAAIHYCAALLESRASDLEAATSDTAKELKALCLNVLELAETVAFAAEHPLWAHEDTELRHPSPTPQRPGASFVEAAAWDMAPQDELDAVAELVGQDAGRRATRARLAQRPGSVPEISRRLPHSRLESRHRPLLRQRDEPLHHRHAAPRHHAGTGPRSAPQSAEAAVGDRRRRRI